MSDLFPLLILGHLVGDYLFQNKWMAMNKDSSNLKCFVHCSIYTITVLMFTAVFWHSYMDFTKWAVVVFLSHFIVDRFSLADKWLDLINGRSLRDFMENGHNNIPASLNCIEYMNYHSLRGGFTALVYAVADNTMHLLLMWGGAVCLTRGV